MKSNFWKGLFLVKRSIQAKIFVAFILVVFFTLMIVSSVWYISTSNIVKTNAINYATDNIQKANENLEVLLEDIDTINTVIAINELNVINVLQKSYESPNYEWFNEFKKITDFLNALMIYKQKVISGIAVVRLDGEVYKAGAPYISENLMEEGWSKKIVGAKGRKVIVKRKTSNYNQNEKVLTIGRAIMHHGTPLGVVFVDMKYDIIKNNFDINYLEDSFIFVVDSEGNIIYHSDESLYDERIEETSYYQVYKNHNQKDENYLNVYYQSSYTKWTTIGMISEAALKKDVIVIQNQTISIVAFAFIIVLFVSIIVSNQISKNLKQLRDTMKSVEEGNLLATPKVDSQDEVGELSRRFTTMMTEIHHLMNNVKKQEEIKRELELKALQGQVGPHFLYNTLNTIKYLAENQNARNITEVTTSLIDLLRITIGKGEQLITIQEEIEHVKSYMNIQKYKYLDKFSVVFHVDEEILRYKTIKMILQPIVENSLIHGIEPLDNSGIVSIKIYRERDTVMFKITDNGLGMSEEQIQRAFDKNNTQSKSRFSGIGIRNVHERIQMFFGDQYGLNVFSELGVYTTVEIQIPILTEGEGEDDQCSYCR